MAPRKTVLGNDPFQRGAAQREEPARPPRKEPKATGEARAPAAVRGEEVEPRREIAHVHRPAAPPPAGAPPSGVLPVAAARADAPASSPGDAARGALAVLRRLTGLPLGAPSLEVDELGRDASLEREVWPLLEWIHDRWFHVQVNGLQNLPDGPVIVVANRAGLVPWDSLMLSVAVRRHGRELRPLVEDYLFHFPGLGLLINRLGAVRACPENAERLLASGAAVAVFPEGAQGMGKRYRDRYRLQRFGRGGFVKLALRTGASIVPAAIVGSEETNPVLARLPGMLGLPLVPITPTFPWLGLAGLLPMPGHWSIELGPPLDLTGHRPADAADDPAVMRLTDTARSTIQAMLDRTLAGRS